MFNFDRIELNAGLVRTLFGFYSGEKFKIITKPIKLTNMEYKIKTGYENMNVEAIHAFLSEHSYWAKNIPYSTVDSALKHSFCMGVFSTGKQIAFARLITDYSTFAYLADVYVLQEYRKQGVSKILMQYIMELEWVNKLRRCMLATLDAHELYKKYGFVPLQYPERFLEINIRDIYKNN